jgi:HEAT repeat protein
MAEVSAPGLQHTVGELVEQLAASDPAVRARAACDLRERGGDAAAAIDALVALLPDAAPLERSVCGQNWWRWNPENRTTPGEQAASALVAIGSRAFDPLVKTLRHSAWFARRNAAWALGALDDRRAVDPLVPLMRDSEAAVREQTAWALGALDDRSAVPALITGLKDADARVRRQAAWAAGAIDDRRAVEQLLVLLGDAERSVREQAAWALGAIGDSRAVDPLLPLLKDPEPTVRRQAAWAIGVLSK